MVRLAVDQNFDARIVSGLLRRLPLLDIVHVRDVGLAEAPDSAILEWTALTGRILLTHDKSTLVGDAYERVVLGGQMPGVIAVTRRCPVGQAIADLELLLECTSDDEWPGRVRFVPL